MISGGTYAAYDTGGSLIDSFATGSGTNNGTQRLDGGIISYILFSGAGGYVGVSGLTYNYDGVTDGRNDDIDVPDDNGPSVVPLPASGFMLLGGLFAVSTLRRRRK